MNGEFHYFKTADGLSIRYCTRKPGIADAAGSAVVLCGRSEFIEKYRETISELNLAVGGGTYGWLDAAFRSIDVLAAAGYVERITTPVLIASSADERVVSRKAQKKLCSRLQDCRFVDIMHAKHEILRERDRVRAQFWKAFDGFVGKQNQID